MGWNGTACSCQQKRQQNQLRNLAHFSWLQIFHCDEYEHLQFHTFIATAPQLASNSHSLQPGEASVYITRVAKGYFYPTGHIVYTPAQEQTQLQPQSEFVSLPAQHGCCTEWKTSLILKLCVCCESAGIDHKLSCGIHQLNS